MVLLPDADMDAAVQIAERLRTAVASTPITLACGQPVTITASFGVSIVLWDEGNVEAALHRADAALYRAKSQGRNKVLSSGRSTAAMLAPLETAALRRAV